MSDLHPLSDATRAFLSRSRPFLIDGRWLPSVSGETVGIINPADGAVLTSAAVGSREDVDNAVAAARRAFAGKRWRGLTPAARGRILWRVADLIEEHGLELAELETLNAGKLFHKARNGEIPAAAEAFRYYAGWCTKLAGHTFIPSVPNSSFHAYTVREPVGVVGQIIPWNGPLVMAAWKLAPALAAGCSCVLKPAEQTPLTALRLGELLQAAGIPDGVVNIVTGQGRVAGAALAQHPDVNKISFTGSTAVGRQLLDDAKGNLKRLSLELGGKSPVLILDDADLDLAIPGAANAIFSGSGQVCVAGSRIYVARKIFDRVVEGVAAIAAKLRLGPGMDPNSEMGPLISEAHRRSVHRLVEKGLEEGAAAAAGAHILPGAGFYYSPTVLINTTRDMTVMREEIFGPVVAINAFDDVTEALRAANDSQYGLAASVWTTSLSQAHALAADLQAGIVWINCHNIPDMALPIGGFKQSGWGREHGFEGLEIYTETKAVMARL